MQKAEGSINGFLAPWLIFNWKEVKKFIRDNTFLDSSNDHLVDRSRKNVDQTNTSQSLTLHLDNHYLDPKIVGRNTVPLGNVTSCKISNTYGTDTSGVGGKCTTAKSIDVVPRRKTDKEDSIMVPLGNVMTEGVDSNGGMEEWRTEVEWMQEEEEEKVPQQNQLM